MQVKAHNHKTLLEILIYILVHGTPEFLRSYTFLCKAYLSFPVYIFIRFDKYYRISVLEIKRIMDDHYVSKNIMKTSPANKMVISGDARNVQVAFICSSHFISPCLRRGIFLKTKYF